MWWVLLEFFTCSVKFLKLLFIRFAHFLELFCMLLRRFQLSLQALNLDLVVGQLPLKEPYLPTELTSCVLLETEDSIFHFFKLLEFAVQLSLGTVQLCSKRRVLLIGFLQFLCDVRVRLSR